MQQDVSNRDCQSECGEYGVSSYSKFLFMKWKRDFFGMNKMGIINQNETDKVEVPFWVFAQYLFLRIMNESISHGGRLRFDDETPYTPTLLANTFGLDEELAKRAFELFERYNLVKWDGDKSLIIPCAMDNIGQRGAGSSTERSRKCRAAKKLREQAEKASSSKMQRSCNATQRCSNAIEKEKEEEKDKEKEIINTPQKPPQGGADVRADDECGSSGVGGQTTDAAERTNGASGFAKPKPRPKGQDEYPMDRLLKAYDEASIQTGGNMPKENREAFCRYVYVNALLENDRRTGNLPGRLRGLYQKWLADGGPHMDAPPITREELAEWVRICNPQRDRKITPELESGFWDWLVAAGFKNGRGRVISKWNVGVTFGYWVGNRQKDGGKSESRKTVADDLMHMRGLGVKPWGIDYKK